MSIVKTAEGAAPTPELIAAVGKLGQEFAQAGVLLEMGGLAPTAKGARIRLSGGSMTVTDGPFTEAKEIIGGYAILKADSKAQAIELARRFMQVHADVLGPSFTMELEIREMVDGPANRP